nr:reverse transcriptase domain-containing protein [Tanacetum cinerariifolium]
MIIFQCRRLEKKQMVENEVNRNAPQEEEGPERVDFTKQMLGLKDFIELLLLRERGRGNEKRRDARKDKVINMIRSWSDDMKRNSIERDESWMKAPMVFPPLSMDDASDEPLIVEEIMEGDLVRRVYVDQGASVEVMDLVGFTGGVVKPLGKIELEKVFDDG